MRGKNLNANILEMANRRTKLSDIWGPEVLVLHYIWGSFQLVVFKVIFGSCCGRTSFSC